MDMDLGKEIRREVELFIQKHVPGASLSSIDDVLLDYLVDVLAEEDSSFDVDQIVEMMTAYIPEISTVDSTVVCEWVFQLASMQQAESRAENEALQTDGIGPSADFENGTSQSHNLLTTRRESCDGEERLNRFSGGDGTGLSAQANCWSEKNDVKSFHPEGKKPLYPDSQKVELVVEMFPEVPEGHIHQTLFSCAGDMDTAIQLLLNQASATARGPAGCSGKPPKEYGSSASLQDEEEKAHVKDFVLSRYAYVPMDEDEKLHCPAMPKTEPKRMVRYRDNQVVSTKGERFTVLTKKDLEPDGMKKTYINLKPLRKYHFH